ncbi:MULTISPECIES: TIGR02301 family protein [Kaistia]|uniref:TIGR02301 family protein n=1 Tax=Kaistia nematophila TaxID=2994654 RepID=A0A9X3ILQ3_9HYPH|nr:TIGR02301 family protein [Kaistia nematophila]
MIRPGHQFGRSTAIALALLLGLAGSPAFAADGNAGSSPVAGAGAATGTGAGAADPPYEQQLQRLAEILGALHYLRPLCGAEEPSVWRDQMDQILAAEDPTPERRARIVSQFNLGFSSFATVYRTCTPAALTAIERYLLEGKKLTRDITARYGR